MRCPICGTADAACGAAPMEKPVIGERTIQFVNAAGDVVDQREVATADVQVPDQVPTAIDVQVDD